MPSPRPSHELASAAYDADLRARRGPELEANPVHFVTLRQVESRAVKVYGLFATELLCKRYGQSLVDRNLRYFDAPWEGKTNNSSGFDVFSWGFCPHSLRMHLEASNEHGLCNKDAEGNLIPWPPLNMDRIIFAGANDELQYLIDEGRADYERDSMPWRR